MTAPTPLVAPREDTTRATSGVALIETGDALHDAIASGSWHDGALAGVGFGIELAAAALDPFGALAAAGIGWLMEHVQPLSDLLDRLTGDPDAVAAQAQTWRNVAAAVRAAGDDLAGATAPAPDWSGAAADAFTRRGAAHAEETRAGARVADALAAAVDGAGSLVSLVREVVRELVAQLVATLVVRVPQWLLEEVGTLGLATPHVVAAASAVVLKVTKQVVNLVRGLTRSLRALGDLVGEVLDLARRLFTPAPRSTPPAPTTPARAASGPAVATHPAAATPDHHFGPGTGPRITPDAPPTTPAARPPDPGPSGAVPGRPPDDLAGIGRIRAALEPDGPPGGSRRPPPDRPPTAVERAAHDQHLDRLAAAYPERYDSFSRNDPDHRGQAGPSQRNEAKIGLDMIDSGRWAPSVRRPTDSGDFVDEATGQKWDIKGFHSDWPDRLLPEKEGIPFPQPITRERFEEVMDRALSSDLAVLLDVRKVDAAALDFMRKAVIERGWAQRVEWYP